MALITMNENELNRLNIIGKVIERRLTKTAAAEALGITPRQVYRLQKAYLENGAEALVSKKRGKPSNRAYSNAFKRHVLKMYTRDFDDFGPTLASEKLKEYHDIDIAVETLRKWLVDADLWKTRTKKLPRAYQPRYRRDCFGELIQVDGSQHWWFEDRGPKCTLLVFIDDATSKIVHMNFAKSENTFDYFKATISYVKRYGKPVALYSDKHSTFRVNTKNAKNTTGMTQFTRALHEINVDLICANSSQAKGRVERVHKTLQDRLVKELRLQNINDIDSANKFLPGYLLDHNKRFAREPYNPKDLHRPLEDHENLDKIMCWITERKVNQNLTLQYDRMVFLLEKTEENKKLYNKTVTIRDYADGRVEIEYENQLLPYSIFDKVRKVNQGQIVSNKRLGAVLALAQEQQSKRNEQRSQNGPKRTGQDNSIFN